LCEVAREPVFAPFHGQVVVLEHQESSIVAPGRLPERGDDRLPIADSRAHDSDPVVGEREARLVQQARGAVGDPDGLVHVEMKLCVSGAISRMRRITYSAPSTAMTPCKHRYLMRRACSFRYARISGAGWRREGAAAPV
jgi:hypothetical protein